MQIRKSVFLLCPSRDLFAVLMMSCDVIDVACDDVMSHALVMMSSCMYLLTAPHLSRDGLRNVFMNVNTSNLSLLCIWLNIPDDKSNDAITAADHYYQSTQPRKVRELIFSLDRIGDTALADSVMDCAEPPAGMYVHSVHVTFYCTVHVIICCVKNFAIYICTLDCYFRND